MSGPRVPDAVGRFDAIYLLAVKPRAGILPFERFAICGPTGVPLEHLLQGRPGAQAKNGLHAR